MKRHPCLLVSFLLLTFFLHIGVTCEAQSEDQKPNVVIFLTDDQGYGELGCYGHPDIKSPNIDQFAEQGMKFTQGYAPSSVCSPTRSAILTGRTPYRNGVYRWAPGGNRVYLQDEEITLAERLRQIGYRTFHAGKWHLNGGLQKDNQPQPNDQGFDHWLATQNNARPSHKFPGNFVRNGTPLDRVDQYSAHFVVDEAIRWLDARAESDRPFFMTVWTHEIHRPVASAPRFKKLYPDQKGATKSYYANVSQLDAAFGKLMKKISSMGETEDTLVFYLSDNGPTGGGPERQKHYTKHLRGNKRDLFEGGIRVPFIVRWPGQVPAGSVSDEPVIGSDIFTTVCHVLDIPLPSDRTIDGASMVPAFHGEEIERDIPMYWRMGGSRPYQIAMRDGRWKILARDDFSKAELFDLKNDPAEQEPLRTERPDVFKRMKQKLISLNEQVEKEGPDWWKQDPNEGYAHLLLKTPEGTDKTGSFDVVRGGTVRNHEEGYQFEATAREAIAMRKLKKPITEKTTISVRYRSDTDRRVKNAMLAFGPEANMKCAKAGTAIGAKFHTLFERHWGSWITKNSSSSIGPSDTFELTLVLTPGSRKVTARINDKTVKGTISFDPGKIKYVGFYTKETKSVFSSINIK